MLHIYITTDHIHIGMLNDILLYIKIDKKEIKRRKEQHVFIVRCGPGLM